jgi:hypothetical protein
VLDSQGCTPRCWGNVVALIDSCWSQVQDSRSNYLCFLFTRMITCSRPRDSHNFHKKIEKASALGFGGFVRTLAMKDKVALHLNPLECLQPYLDSDGYVGISHSKTHRPIIDSTVIDINAADSSAVPSWDLFSLQ